MHQHGHFFVDKVSKFLEAPFYGCVDYDNLVEDISLEIFLHRFQRIC